MSIKPISVVLQLMSHACMLARPPKPPAKKSNDLATFVEARLGKPSHLLEGDKLRQFIANNGKVLRFW